MVINVVLNCQSNSHLVADCDQVEKDIPETRTLTPRSSNETAQERFEDTEHVVSQEVPKTIIAYQDKNCILSNAKGIVVLEDTVSDSTEPLQKLAKPVMSDTCQEPLSL